MEYLKVFDTEAQYDAYVNSGEYVAPNVSLVTDETVKYNVQNHDYSKDYFTVKAITSGNFGFSKRGDSLKYRVNGGEWVISEGNVSNLPLVPDDEIEISFAPGNNDEIYGNILTFTGQFEVYGNIFSLMYGDNFANYNTLNTVFAGMFNGNTNIISAENLILPATTLIGRAYHSMFAQCSNLEKAPVLPAKTLEANCYNAMFVNCAKLNYIKCLATDISAANCTQYWLINVSPTGTFVKDANITNWPSGGDGIPSGWTVQDAE